MRQLLIRSYLEFCQQYWLHCRWDKISLEGTDDLHSKDKTVAQQQHSTVIPQLSRAQILQQRHNAKKTLCVCVFMCVQGQAFPLPPTLCPLSLQSPAFISPRSRIQFATSYRPLLPLAAEQHTINTDFTWQLANNSMSYNYWAKDRRWEEGGEGMAVVCAHVRCEWCSWVSVWYWSYVYV